MHSFYSKRRLKRHACFLMIVMLINIFFPTVSWALTSGPSQPEVQSFEPAGTTQMVDLFTGDFTYNIPLFELPGPNGGYPFNLAYHAGVGMDTEASWCGLGWNLNPGSISRQMRGLPDEFKGDEITTKMSMKPSRTIGTGAGVGAEIFGGLGIGADMSLFYNNYKGTGVEVGVTLSYSKSVGSGANAGLGVGLSVNSQEGVGVNPSLSLKRKLKEYSGQEGDFSKSGSIFVGAGYNSRVGLTGISTGVSVSIDRTKNEKGEETNDHLRRQGYSSTLSLANPGFTPSVGMPMINSSINMSFELGASWWGIYPNIRFSGFYNEQKLEHDKKNVKTPSYGYLHYQDAKEINALLDFNREKDGLVRDENPNLPIPSLTYDIYTATGQGYSAMYRPMRADVGTIHDPYETSVSKGLSLGGDIGPAVAHIGFNGTVNHAVSQSGKWEENNEVNSLYNFRNKESNSTYESVYFKAHGEPTVTPVGNTDDIGGEDAVRLSIGGKKANPTAQKTLVKDKHKNWSKTAKDNSTYNAERIARNSVITPITNETLKGASGEETIDLFKIDYITSSGSPMKYNRSAYPGHHNAGFIALTPEGNRYVYGLPAYNTYQEEVSFSSPVVSGNTKVNVTPINSDGEPNYDVSGTNKYLDKRVIPPYAHSYLLTAIVGQDYVDVKGDGVTEDDLGYWVKFTYQQKASKSLPYKWRAPFYKANYFSGFKTTKEDDRASYMYGEKEIWYLSRVETKSHVADFKISTREDARGAKYKLQNSSGLGATLSKLDEIILYTRHAGTLTPLKKVKFVYTYDLCKNVENAASGVGKLTLKKLYFEYGTSQRGRLNPYIFDYNEDVPAENPNYDIEDYDRWGNFKPNDPSDLLKNQEYPYVDQSEPKSVHDLRAGVWNLKEITLPSGGHMIIDYEADDYAYVQNRTAMQMLDLVEPGRTPGNFELNDGDLKMCFKLPVPVEVKEGVDSVKAARSFFESDRDMLYFKLKMNLRSPSENQFDFITTYANLDKSKPPYLSKGASGSYEYGYFTLKSEKGYHPLSLRAWQHLKVNQPDLASAAGKVNVDDNESGLVSTLKGLASIIPQVRQMFTGFYDYCRNRHWGRELEAGRCWVRLQVPNKIKYGGGHRVKQITFKDNWKEDNEGIYGQVYQYTIDEDGAVISSGVAANEPLIGGDENPIRYAKRFTESIPLISNNTLFFEYPVNEGYFPGPQVGYSKVTVMSLASAAAAGEGVLHAERAAGKSLFPAKESGSFGTTGKTENEFYTARDFPVITDETLKEDIQNRTWIPIFPLGTISGKQLSSSQGYSIITNDMHGKPKKVSYYAQSTTGGFVEEPFSWVRYNYMEGGSLVRGDKVSKGLNNVFVDNKDGTLSKATSQDLQNSQAQLYHMGQETEFFADMRLHIDKSYFGGAAGNIDIVIIPIAFITVPVPIPSVWPSAGKDEKLLKTAVMNKVIFKSGILESVEAFNDGSHIVTRNVKWDKLTGRPVLTVVNNNFDKPRYNFEVPAHLVYEGLGPAYENTGFTFDISRLSAIAGLDNYYLVNLNYKTRKTLFEGDEIVLIGPDSIPKGKGVYLGKIGSSYQVFSKDNLADTTYNGFVYRSGKRNILSANAGNISALNDPTQSSGAKTYSIDILNEE